MAATPRENAALIRQVLSDVVAGANTNAAPGFLAEDVAAHSLVFGDGLDHAEVTALGWRVLAATAGDVLIEDTVTTTGRVAVRAKVTGTHRESLIDLAPIGRSFDIVYAWFCRIEDGEVVESWSLPDGLGLMRQLEALPDQPPNHLNTHTPSILNNETAN